MKTIIFFLASYFSNKVTETTKKPITLNNLSPGAHELEVYKVASGSNIYSNGTMNVPVSGSPVYSKTFQLRQGYDMNISVKPNGLVTFSEKPAKKKKQELTSHNKTPMTSTAFNQLYKSVNAKKYQSQKITTLTSTFNNTTNHFTTVQVRDLLSLVTSESRRLELAKLSYSRVTDPANFVDVYDVLKSQANRDALDDYVVARGGGSNTFTNTNEENNAAYVGPAMNDAAFNELLSTAGGHFFQSNTVKDVRAALNTTANYFTTYQVRQLVGLVTSEVERLSLVKLAYSRTTDPASFYQLADLFTTQAYKTDLNNYIRSKGGVVSNETPGRTPMSDATFNQVYQKARLHFFQKNTVADVRAAFSNASYYFATEQIRQLLLLVSSESERLSLAKLSYARVSDPHNFSHLYDVFTTQANRDELSNYVSTQVIK